MSEGLSNVVLLVPIFLFSLCFHEYAHAWVAVKRGDPTPSILGRLSMHPLAHADLVGTLLLPILCIYNGWPFFGWAKPVPVDSRNLKKGRHDMALVAAAGPAANLILAVVATVLLSIETRLPFQHHVIQSILTFTVVSIQVNLMLAFFNLLPIPPLDGFMIAQGFMSQAMANRFLSFARYANLVLLVLLLTGGLRYLSIPVRAVFDLLLRTALPTMS